MTRMGQLRMTTSSRTRSQFRDNPQNYRRANRRRVEAAQQEWDRTYRKSAGPDETSDK